MSALGFDLDRLVEEHALNAWLAWTGVAVLVVLTFGQVAGEDLVGATLTAAVAFLAGAAGPFHRTLDVTLPWEVVAIAAAVCGWNALAAGPVAFYSAVTVAVLVAVCDLHLFTSARVSHRVAAGLVVVGTAAVAGGWLALRWTAASVGLVGTAIPTHEVLMGDLVVAAAAGLLGGIAFELYVVGWEARVDRFTPLLEGEP